MWLVLAIGMPVATAQTGASDSGRRIAENGIDNRVAACSSCHGAAGEGNAAFPPLRGAGREYLVAQLEAFADGSRRNTVMQPVAEALSPAQRRAVASYYSSLALPPPVAGTVVPPARPSQAGAWLAERGRWSQGLPACAQCHGPLGRGVGAHFPPLAGLPQAYIGAQLRAWKAGERPPGPLGLMAMVASKLSDEDIDKLSAHYAQLLTRGPATRQEETGGLDQ